MNKLKLFGSNLEKELVVIAELGINHAGSIRWIMEMLPKLKDAGASAVKLQLFTPDLYVSRSNQVRHKFLQSVFLSKTDFVKIVNFGESINLPIFATPLSHDWVEFVAETCGVVKVASGDFTFLPTIRSALKSSATVIASTGVATNEEINTFLELTKIERKNAKESVALLHCVAAYPPPLNQANIRAIPFLKNLTGFTIGFSSHFLDDAPIYAALALGSRIFEIHVTDNRERRDIRDHILSRTPQELNQIVSNLRSLDESMVDSSKTIQLCELENIAPLKKGVIYSKDLPAGHVLTHSDVTYARPFNPSIPNIESIVGKKLSRNVSAFCSASFADIE